MGMFLSKYSMLNAIGYGAEPYVERETEKILSNYKLIGLVLHDQEVHQEFHKTMEESFERLDYLTGKDFLFFTLTEAPQRWINRNENRDFFGIWEPEKLFSPFNRYQTEDESVAIYSLLNSLGLEMDDLPVIILTNNLGSNQFMAIKTCAVHLNSQLTEIGFFCTQKDSHFYFENDVDFQRLIMKIDVCGGNIPINHDQPLAHTLSDFLAFYIPNNGRTNDTHIAQNNINQTISRFLSTKNSEHDPNRFEQPSLFLLGSLYNLYMSQWNDISESIDFKFQLEDKQKKYLQIDNRCERECRLIFMTYETVYNHFNSIRRDSGQKFDYSILVIPLGKIFEIETNLSVTQWIRNYLNIEMPKYFNRRKEDFHDYSLLPTLDEIPNPRAIDFNRGRGKKWIPPGLGESELAFKSLFRSGRSPDHIRNGVELIHNWEIIRQYRNRASHTDTLIEQDFDKVYQAFRNIVDQNHLSELNDLKESLKQ